MFLKAMKCEHIARKHMQRIIPRLDNKMTDGGMGYGWQEDIFDEYDPISMSLGRMVRDQYEMDEYDIPQ